MERPILYLDVDGVLFGRYGNPAAFQLRPNVNSFISWALQNFDVKWLTWWSEQQIRDLMSLIYCPKGREAIEYVSSWKTHKTSAIQPGSDFYWVEDEPSDEDMEALRQWGQTGRLVLVDENGIDGLDKARRVLQRALVRRAGSRLVLVPSNQA